MNALSNGGAINRAFYKKAIDFVHKNNKVIGFAIADKDMVSFLNGCGADFWKTLSISISDKDLQDELQQTGKLTFVSTGTSDEAEILRATKELRNIRLIHTQLSQRLEDTNLKAIGSLRSLTGREVAFGLHCSDSYVLYASVAFDPSDYFVYVKENSQEEYPDDKHALLIDEVAKVAAKLRDLRKALGSGKKEKMESRLE